MVINMYRYRMPIAIVCLVFAFIPLYFKFSHSDSSPRHDKKSPYGKYLNWQEVNNIFTQYAVVTVTDLETGLEFCVQRRAGYYHADVQPLTAEDTAVMKKIYNSKWTWKRRAVIVQMDDGIKIAASMNGMPHGQGAIKGNKFNGHFCIHFADSKTHGSRKVDLAHQMMIWKSANILDKQLGALSPEETMTVFFTALNQGDKTISTRIIDSKDEACWKILQEIESIRVISIAPNNNNCFSVGLRLKYKDDTTEINRIFVIKLSKKSSGWKIDPDSFSQLLRGRIPLQT